MSLKDYWINELKETAEFKALAGTEDVDFSVLALNTLELLDDQFIATATEYGIAKREVMLQILPKAEDSLETRRLRVSFLWSNQLPYTYRKLEEQLDSIAPGGYVLILNHGAYTLQIKMTLQGAGLIEAVQQLAAEMVPANMLLEVSLLYNTHNILANYSHAQLGVFTHDGLRNSPDLA